MISNNQLQTFCVNNGVTKDGYILLHYFHSRFFPYSIKNSDIYSDMPMFFSSKPQLSDAINSLVESGFIEVSDNRTEYEITWHHSKVRELFDSVESVLIKKPRVKTVKKEIDESETVRLTILNHYKTLGNLKQQSKMTDFLRTAIDKSLETYSKEQVIEALSYANTCEWLANSIDKLWNNAGWVIKNIENFMEGGKYRKFTKEEPAQKNTAKYYDDVGILTL